jgi:hypothetical protein
MRKRFYLAVIVLAILLLALGGLVVRSTATAVRTMSGLFDRRVRWASESGPPVAARGRLAFDDRE